MFYLFQSSIAASVFMLQVFYLDVAYVFSHMLKVYGPDVSLFQTYVVFKCFTLHVFHACSESQGARGWGAARRWLADAARGALGAGDRGHDGGRGVLAGIHPPDAITSLYQK
jgi:hypothetical protein